jgi:5'-AMP-activated protein kinase catalytic alpha subunit
MVNGEPAGAECTRASLLGRYEIGRTLGEGNFGKVKYARHIGTGGHFAIKILDRSKILSLRIDDQVYIIEFFCSARFEISIQSAGRSTIVHY